MTAFGLWLPHHLLSWGPVALGTHAEGKPIQPILSGTCMALPGTLRHPLPSRASDAIPGWALPLQESPGPLSAVCTHCCCWALPSEWLLFAAYPPSIFPTLESEGMGKWGSRADSPARNRSCWFPQHQRAVMVISDNTTDGDVIILE